MTYYCSECVVNWAPYQTTQGCCPECGGGTVRRHEPLSEDAVNRYHKARRRSEFEEYYLNRAVREFQAQLDLLPTAHT